MTEKKPEPEIPEYEVRLNPLELGLIIGALSYNMKTFPDNTDKIVNLMAKLIAVTQEWHE